MGEERGWEELSEDVKICILKKASSADIRRAMCTSKAINSLISSPNFMIETSEAIKSMQRRLLQVDNEACKDEYHIYSLNPSDGKQTFILCKDKDFDNFEIINDVPIDSRHYLIGSCRGLVCFANIFNHTDLDLVVWNPCLRKSLTIPTPLTTAAERSGALGFGFGFDAASAAFKVVRTGVYTERRTTMWADIYSLHAANWKTVVGSLSRPVLRITEQGVFINGVIHWIVKVEANQLGQDCGYIILAYDLAEERFREMDVVPTTHRYMVLTTLVIKGEEKLAMYSHDRLCNVWVMECYGLSNTWKHICSVGCGSDLGKVLNAWADGTLTLASSTGKLSSVNLEGGNNENVRANPRRTQQMMLDYVGPYVESLVFPVPRTYGGY